MKQKKLVPIYLMTFVLAACSLLYELLIAETIALLLHNAVVWYCLTIGFYLGAMGLGAWACYSLSVGKNEWKVLFRVEVGLSLLGGGSVFLVREAFLLKLLWSFGQPYWFNKMLFLASFFIMTSAIGFLTGMELPLLLRAAKNITGEKKATNRVLSADYFGSLFAGLIFPLVMVPRMDLFAVSCGVALINLFCSAIILLRFRKQSRKRRGTWIGLSIIFILLGTGWIKSNSFEQYFLKKKYYASGAANVVDVLSPIKGMPKVERYHSAYHRIDIVKNPFYAQTISPVLRDAYSTKFIEDPDYPPDYTLLMNGLYQMRTESDEIYHEYFAHVPIILNKKIPKSVLVLGAGDGLLIKELIKYPGIKKIVHVEIDKTIVQLAKQHSVLSKINGQALSDPRVETVIMDAFEFIKKSSHKFDAVYMDFAQPEDYRLSKLYSREFFQLLSKILSDEGFIALDAPGVAESYPNEDGEWVAAPDDPWPKYYATFKAAGFKSIVPFLSKLEVDNPKAYEAVENVFQQEQDTSDIGEMIVASQIQQMAAAQMLRDYVSSVEQGYLIVRKGFPRDDYVYWNPRVKLHVLNKSRFSLAFQLPKNFNKNPMPDASQINSIFRPTMPDIADFLSF